MIILFISIAATLLFFTVVIISIIKFTNIINDFDSQLIVDIKQGHCIHCDKDTLRCIEKSSYLSHYRCTSCSWSTSVHLKSLNY
jgi:hypothetical protein